MGLEIVEIIMALEDEFAVSIEDHDLRDVRTVGDLSDVIAAKVGLNESPSVCMTSRVFYQLRRGLMQTTGRQRREITPDTRLDEILPELSRAHLWRTWTSRSEVRLPRLRLHEPLHTAWLAATLVAAVATAWGVFWMLSLVGVTRADTALPFLVVGWIPVVLVWVLLTRLGSRWATVFPGAVQTVGDLTRMLVERGTRPFTRGRESHGTVSRSTVWNRVVEVIVRDTNVKRELITPEATFRDLQL